MGVKIWEIENKKFERDKNEVFYSFIFFLISYVINGWGREDIIFMEVRVFFFE